MLVRGDFFHASFQIGQGLMNIILKDPGAHVVDSTIEVNGERLMEGSYHRLSLRTVDQVLYRLVRILAGRHLDIRIKIPRPYLFFQGLCMKPELE